MTTTRAWGAPAAGAPLEPLTITRRDLRDDDVRIAIEYAGVCHSDIHTVRGEFGPREYPLVPGHEIVGSVTEVGSEVTTWQVGDRVGVGCFINSCGTCDECVEGEESYCSRGPIFTYGGRDRYTDDEYSQGGYSQEIVVRDAFVVRIPDALPMDKAAPLLCAGITTYSPLKLWEAGPGKRVAIVGMGGLGHVAVKIAVAMGAEVTVFSHSEKKREDALAFGAQDLYPTREGVPRDFANYFDLIINTVSVDLDIDDYMRLLRYKGVFVQLGLPPAPMETQARMYTSKRRVLTGSLVGGIRETQEMLDFCAEHNVTPEIELIDAFRVNESYDRTVNSDVRYRFVIDTATM
ncbi:NAD(P)-dependent alcohol dehydrogenase [Corynebacterium breve]|uniref:alcohol dehydrogenase (NADP(+)) n=1 Tax=Corynebacterium breve TaxID=3049799 RepID=A0ABY8VEU8_9CORY|nr:NAD(P)-dependent alcohol dehydrogenase [Corynebacterium breve]WIM67857.1 NAD(P)-dependent alcohol dehydrogenase [Corynebacterium breve]